MLMKKITGIFLGSLIVTLGAGCASKIKKADIAETANPQEEITQLEERISEGYAAQYDVLAPKEFKEAREWLDEAKDELADGDDQSEILESIGYATAYLNKAEALSTEKQAQIDGILKAREMAITAGAKSFGETRGQLKKLDDELRANSRAFDKNFNVDDQTRLQGAYSALELQATQQTQLGDARAQIHGVRRTAEKRAPNTLKKADLDVNTAMNVIAAERRSPEAYSEAVLQARQSAQNLVEIVQIAEANGRETTEPVAIKLWEREKAIGNLQGDLESAEQGLSEMSGVVSEQDRLIASNQAKISMQQAMDEVRKEFTEDQAEVYQQGDKLIIRLKQVKFDSGKSEIPSQATALLEKVNAIISQLSPESVEVQGHTDSTGGAQANNILSQKRAESVAEFLKRHGLTDVEVDARGYGFQKPLASNKDAEGRAKNRRVDLVIEPGQPASETTQE